MFQLKVTRHLETSFGYGVAIDDYIGDILRGNDRVAAVERFRDR